MTYSDDVVRLNPQLCETAEKGLKSPSKYHNTRTESKGLLFASGHEAAEIGKLILLDERYEVFGLRLQIRFPLPGGNSYIADAVYLELQEGRLIPVVADAKGMLTPTYKVKKRAFKAHYGLEITEL